MRNSFITDLRFPHWRGSPLPEWTYQHEQCQAFRATTTVYDRVLHADAPPENYNLEDSPVLDETTIAAAIDLLDRQQLRTDLVEGAECPVTAPETPAP